MSFQYPSVRDRVTTRVAGWRTSIAATVVVSCGLVIHEIAYHLTDGDDYPLTLLADDTRVLVVSHGGLDALGVGALAVATIAAIETARDRHRHP